MYATNKDGLRQRTGTPPCDSLRHVSKPSRINLAMTRSHGWERARSAPKNWRSSALSQSSAWEWCMATAATAYKQSFGFDAPPYTYQDFEESDVLVFVGSNLCIAHPIMWQRVCKNKNRPEIIVVDPRKTETAMAATQHYAIKPQSDLFLLYGLANMLIESGSIDYEYIGRHTSGFAAFAAFVRPFTLAVVGQATGLTTTQLRKFAETVRRGKRVSLPSIGAAERCSRSGLRQRRSLKFLNN